jgi:hypothetical protein
VRVGYFCLQSWWPLLFGQALDLIQQDLDEGHEVHVVRPSKAMRYSDTSRFDVTARWYRRELRQFWTGMDLLSPAPAVHSVASLARSHPLSRELRELRVPRFESHAALDAFRFHGHDAGNAVLSSLVWSLRDTDVDLELQRDFIERALNGSILVYIAARALIDKLKPDRVVVANGRMASFRGVLRACQETGTECLVHEVGAELDRVELAKNTMPHDTGWIARQIAEAWKNSDHSIDEKRAIARSFYERKRSVGSSRWGEFTEGQEKGRLPFRESEGQPVYSLFSSSECERIALSQYYRYPVHESQLAGIIDVIRILEVNDFPGLLCIRLHPNSVDDKPSLLAQLEGRVKQDFVRLIPADSPVDTYALIDASEKVFTFGSTVSMEAAYAGKPTVSFASSSFEQLDSVFHPQDRDEVVRLVSKPLEPQLTEDTLKYGYFRSVCGSPLRYARPTDLKSCYFKGKALHGRQEAKRGWRLARLRSSWRRHFAGRAAKAEGRT